MAPGVGEISTGDSSVCSTGGSASMVACGRVRSAAFSTPTTFASRALRFSLRAVRLPGVASMVFSSELSRLPSRLPSPVWSKALTVIGEVFSSRPSRFRSIAGTVSSRNWSGSRVTGGDVGRRDARDLRVQVRQELRQPGVDLVDGQRRAAGCRTGGPAR